MPLFASRFNGTLYRALNPIYARMPLSGLGAGKHGGRFNAKSRASLYASLSPSTALREANQVGSLQPIVLVPYSADLGPIFDSRDSSALEQREMTRDMLADEGWRVKLLSGKRVPTQDFANALIEDGYVGLLVRSYATG